MAPAQQQHFVHPRHGHLGSSSPCLTYLASATQHPWLVEPRRGPSFDHFFPSISVLSGHFVYKSRRSPELTVCRGRPVLLNEATSLFTPRGTGTKERGGFISEESRLIDVARDRRLSFRMACSASSTEAWEGNVDTLRFLHAVDG